MDSRYYVSFSSFLSSSLPCVVGLLPSPVVGGQSWSRWGGCRDFKKQPADLASPRLASPPPPTARPAPQRQRATQWNKIHQASTCGESARGGESVLAVSTGADSRRSARLSHECRSVRSPLASPHRPTARLVRLVRTPRHARTHARVHVESRHRRRASPHESQCRRESRRAIRLPSTATPRHHEARRRSSSQRSRTAIRQADGAGKGGGSKGGGGRGG